MPNLTEYFGVTREWIAEQAGEITKTNLLYPDSFELINRVFKDLSNEDKAKIHIILITILNGMKQK